MTVFSFAGVRGIISEMPGSTICISHGVYSSNPGQGHGTRANAARLEKMKALGFEYAICTVDANNRPQRAIMNKNGWKWLAGYKSEKTGHTVYLFGHPL